MRDAHNAVLGTVRSWNDRDGVGVLLTPDGTSVWCHYSMIRTDGRQTLIEGQAVRFDFETPGQDGHEARVANFVEPVE